MILLLNIAGLLLACLGWMVWSKALSPKAIASSPKEKSDVESMTRYPDVKIKRITKYRISMGLHKLDRQNWLIVDRTYRERHKIRMELLRNQRSMIVQCLPQAREACEETLHEVATFLCHRYPWMFEMYRSGGRKVIRNKETVETFPMEHLSKEMSPLEIASRLTMEDLTVLLKNDDGEHYIGATTTFFPIGWSADRVLGYTVSKMHEPVPQWQEQVGNAVNKFFTRLTPTNPMERASYFIQVTYPDEPMSSILFQPDGVVHENLNPGPDDIIVRKERQIFTRLPKSSAILFAVKTSLTRLRELPLDELENLVTELQSWPEDMAQYKGRDHWGPVVMAFCRARKEQLQSECLTSFPPATGTPEETVDGAEVSC